MIPYLLLLSVVSLGALAGLRRGKPLLIAIGLVYFVMIGWRHRVGMDWNNYVAILDKAKASSLQELVWTADPAFGTLLWVANSAGGITFLNAVSAAIFCIGLFAFAQRCREPFLALTVATSYLVFVIAMSSTRQALALGIIFFLFSRWDRLRVPEKAAFVLAAAAFHISALLNLVFVVLQSRMSGPVRLIVSILIVAVLFTIVSLVPDRVGFYVETYVAGTDTVESAGALFHVLLLSIPAFLYFVLRRKWTSAYGRSDLVDQLALASIIALPLLLISSTGVDRLSLYLWPLAMYVWAGLPALAARPATRVALRAFVVAGSAAQALLWLLYANSSYAWLPYRNSLFGM